jgi:mono/diheme cytochrome c family protein
MTLPDQSPVTPPETIAKYLQAPPGVPEQGRRLFVFYCTACHGSFGRGDGYFADSLYARNHVRPRDLTDSLYFSHKADLELFATVSLGGGHFKKSPFMPAWTVTLAPEQIKDLVSYIRALSHTPSGM